MRARYLGVVIGLFTVSTLGTAKPVAPSDPQSVEMASFIEQAALCPSSYYGEGLTPRGRRVVIAGLYLMNARRLATPATDGKLVVEAPPPGPECDSRTVYRPKFSTRDPITPAALDEAKLNATLLFLNRAPTLGPLPVDLLANAQLDLQRQTTGLLDGLSLSKAAQLNVLGGPTDMDWRLLYMDIIATDRKQLKCGIDYSCRPLATRKAWREPR